MAAFNERSPRERETLIFQTPEEAIEFADAARERLAREQRNGVRRDREIVGEVVADAFGSHGHGVHSLKLPWQHTPEEHAEVQQLADLAFAKDLGAALRDARGSAHFPRNLDLLHDVLTTELYEALTEHRINTQPVTFWIMIALGIVIVTLIATVLLIFNYQFSFNFLLRQ